MIKADPIDRFKALDGFRFAGPSGDHYVLHAGMYCTGNGAFEVEHEESGEGECKLTVNMTECAEAIEDDEFWVKLETIEFSEVPAALLELGIFQNTGKVQPGPFGTPYAQIWRFAPKAGA